MCSAPQAITLPPDSTTTKSRIFSQTSANDRGNNVPSPEYCAMSRWMASASGSMALRVRKRGLLKLLQRRANLSQRSLDLPRRGPAGHVVLGNHATELKGCRKIFTQQLTEFASLRG